jgi:aminoglycoside phosphotransferase (APT) family kinase protein
VLRCKPQGSLDKTAHLIEREYVIQSVLGDSDVPVARMYHLCEDHSVIGTTFYVMQFVDGLVTEDPRLGCINPAQRREIYFNAVSVLANLHSIDWTNNSSLRSFGKPSGFLRRQVDRFGDQLDRYPEISSHNLRNLRALLESDLPEQRQTTLFHGDFRTANLATGPSGEICAVLDWELSTLGDPLVDLAYFLVPYHLSPENSILPGMYGLNLPDWHLPSEAELIRLYLETVKASDMPHWGGYLAFAIYRMTVITGGVFLRRAKADRRKLSANEHQVLSEFATAGCRVIDTELFQLK